MKNNETADEKLRLVPVHMEFGEEAEVFCTIIRNSVDIGRRSVKISQREVEKCESIIRNSLNLEEDKIN